MNENKKQQIISAMNEGNELVMNLISDTASVNDIQVSYDEFQILSESGLLVLAGEDSDNDYYSLVS